MKPHYRWTGEAWRLTDESISLWPNAPWYLLRGDLNWTWKLQL